MGALNIQEVAFIRECHISEIHKHIQSGLLSLEPDGSITRESFDKYLKAVASKHYNVLAFDNKKGNYSVKQAAELLKVDPQKIYDAINAGALKAVKNGRRLVLHHSDLKKFSKKVS